LRILICIFFAIQSSIIWSAAPTRVCGKYSTILLAKGETAEVNATGEFSLALLVKGPRGNWIFFDSLAEPASAARAGTPVPAGRGAIAYRRSHDARIYIIHPAPPRLVDGKMVKTGVVVADMMRDPLDDPAIVGDDSDIDVIKRVLPGERISCDLQFVPGQGLVSSGVK
jgi:hypothetical protein